MVPVIATILDNYFQVIEKCRERAEIESRRKCPWILAVRAKLLRWSSTRNDAYDSRSSRARRQVTTTDLDSRTTRAARSDGPTSEVTPTHRLRIYPSALHPRERLSHASIIITGLMADERSLQPRALARTHALPSLLCLLYHYKAMRQHLRIPACPGCDRLPSMMPTLHAANSALSHNHPQRPSLPSNDLTVREQFQA